VSVHQVTTPSAKVDGLLEHPRQVEAEWEEAVRAGIEARQAADKGRWVLGDLALTVETQYRKHSLEEYAERVGVAYDTLRRYRSVSQAFEIGTRVPNLPWSHHRAVAAYPDRLEWLQRAAEGRWSVSVLQNKLWIERAARKLDSYRRYQEQIHRERQERAEVLKDLRQEVAQQLTEGSSTAGILIYLDSLHRQASDWATKYAARQVRQELQDQQRPPPPPPPRVSEETRLKRQLIRILWGLLQHTDAMLDQDPAEVAAAVTSGFADTPVAEGVAGILQRRDTLDNRMTLIVQWIEGFLKELRQ
jgi:hypothetical protein